MFSLLFMSFSSVWIILLSILCVVAFLGISYYVYATFVRSTTFNTITVPVSEEYVYEEDELGNLTKEKLTKNEEVFNLGSNIFTYKEAKAACTAFGSALASYENIKNAYDTGADWCNYGWSKDQMALYPTQQSSYDKLPKRLKDACGKPGVNGGYFADPTLRFGVNCYGIRPTEKELDKLFSNYDLEQMMPTQEEWLSEFSLQVQKYKKEKDSIVITPFNKQHWSSHGS